MKRRISRCFAIFMFSFAFILLIGCNDNAQDRNVSATDKIISTEYYVTEVSGLDFMFNDTEEGGMISFAFDEYGHCGLTFVKSKFVRGYSTRVSGTGGRDIDLTCISDKYTYSLLGKENTYAQLTIVELGDDAILDLGFSLYSARAAQMLTRNNIRLAINRQQLALLLASK